MPRLSKVLAIFGKSGSGKSWFVMNVLIPFYQKHHPHKRIAIVNDSDHPDYNEMGIKAVPVQWIPKWTQAKAGSVRQVIIGVTNKEVDEAMLILHKHFYNGVVIFEDPKKYIQQSPSKPVTKFFGDGKNHNVEIIFMYWHPADMPPTLISWIYAVFLFTLSAPLSIAKDKLGSAYYVLLPAYKRVQERYARAKQRKLPDTHPDLHPYEEVIVN